MDNARVKAARALHRSKGRRDTGYCLVEGPHATETALQAGAIFQHVFVSPRFTQSKKAAQLLLQLEAADVPVFRAKDHVVQRMSDTETSQGIVAIVCMQAMEPGGFQSPSALVVADNISDPGNLGTIVRSAAAVGAGLWTSIGSTDVYDPKAVRASVGTLFLLPHSQRLSPEQIINEANRLGYALVVADAGGDTRYDEYDWRPPYALVIGNEARGVDGKLVEAADAIIRVPLATGVESLNAAVTASVCLFEAWRQRNFGHR